MTLYFYSDFLSIYLFYMVIMSSFISSAQIPFSCWLPAAMTAPTLVSSLVHSSTLVTAGVYLLIRFFNQFVLMIINFLSLMTTLISSICANYVFDIKSIIALSTLSQLCLMMSSLFFGLVDFSFFHLMTHAMFKSSLFLCSGIFIYYMVDNQDIRLMGSVCSFMPLTPSCFNMYLCGVPFLSGFYSKDLVIEFIVFNNFNIFVFDVFYFCLGLTVSYSFRLFYYSMIFENSFISYKFLIDNLDFMKLSIFSYLFSIFSGCVLMWLINFDLCFLFFPFYLSVSSLVFVILGFLFGFEFAVFNFYLFGVDCYFLWVIYGLFMVILFFVYFSFSFGLFSSNLNLEWGEYYGSLRLSFYLL